MRAHKFINTSFMQSYHVSNQIEKQANAVYNFFKLYERSGNGAMSHTINMSDTSLDTGKFVHSNT